MYGQYQFILVANESEEMFEEWGTENFKYPLPIELVISDYSLEGAIQQIREKCKRFSNEDWDWESDEEGTCGWLACGNDVDGLQLRWGFKLLV